MPQALINLLKSAVKMVGIQLKWWDWICEDFHTKFSAEKIRKFHKFRHIPFNPSIFQRCFKKRERERDRESKITKTVCLYTENRRQPVFYYTIYNSYSRKLPQFATFSKFSRVLSKSLPHKGEELNFKLWYLFLLLFFLSSSFFLQPSSPFLSFFFLYPSTLRKTPKIIEETETLDQNHWNFTNKFTPQYLFHPNFDQMRFHRSKTLSLSLPVSCDLLYILWI